MVSIRRYRVQVSELCKYVDPLSGWLWGCDRISPDEVTRAVSEQQFESEPWDTAKDRLHGPDGRDFHIRRVAHFVQNGLPSDQHSIQLDLQPQPNGSKIGVMNGNHRIAAALVRGERTIDVTLYFFDQADVCKLIPGSIPL